MPSYKGVVQRKSRRQTARARMWTALRILRTFTIVELARVSSAKADNVSKYVQSLKRHGYIKELPGFRGGRPGRMKTFMVVKNTGSDHPIVCNECDRNLGFPCEPKEEINDAA